MNVTTKELDVSGIALKATDPDVTLQPENQFRIFEADSSTIPDGSQDSVS